MLTPEENILPLFGNKSQSRYHWYLGHLPSCNLQKNLHLDCQKMGYNAGSTSVTKQNQKIGLLIFHAHFGYEILNPKTWLFFTNIAAHMIDKKNKRARGKHSVYNRCRVISPLKKTFYTSNIQGQGNIPTFSSTCQVWLVSHEIYSPREILP